MTCHLLLWLLNLLRLLGWSLLLRLSHHLAPHCLLATGRIVYCRCPIRIYKRLTWNKTPGTCWTLLRKYCLLCESKQSCFNWLLLSWPATGIKGSSLTISHYSNYSIRQLLFFSRQDSRYLFQQDDFPRNGWKVTMAIRWFRCYGYLKSFSDESINIKIELGANTEGRECSLTFSSNTTAVKCTQLLLKQYGL